MIMKIEYVWQSIFVIIGALASAYGGYWVGNRPDHVQQLEYRIDTDASLKRNFGRSGDVKLIYKGSEQTDISRVTIRVANTSKKNAEKIKIYIETQDKSRSAIITDFDVPDGYPRDVVKIVAYSDGVCFEVDYMNHTEEFWDSFLFTLYFSGDKPPKAEVKLAAKGFSLRKYEFSKIDRIDILCAISSDWSFWCVLLLYICCSCLWLRYQRVAKELRLSHANEILADMIRTPIDGDKETFLKETIKQIFAWPSFHYVISTWLKKE